MQGGGPQTWPVVQNLPDPNYWDNMAAWLQTVVGWVNVNWPITVFMIRIKQSLAPLVDPSTGTSEQDMFYIESPNFPGVILNIVPPSYAIFTDQISQFAAVVVSQLANNAGVTAPPANQPTVPAPAVRIPASNPVGPIFDAGNGVTGYVNLNSGPGSQPVGSTITENGVNYVLIGVPSMFGTRTYWKAV